MKEVEARELRRQFRDQYGLARRSSARALGVSAAEVGRRVACGDWDLPYPTVIRSTSVAPTPEQALLAGCLAGGPAAVASHQSAAWLWDLADVPTRPALTLPRQASARIEGVTVHRPVAYPAGVSVVRRIPCTNPLRTLVDLAAVVPPRALDDAIDRALHRHLVTIDAICAERDRLGGHGRTGAGILRSALLRRGFVGQPYPSVLESRTLRLLRTGGIMPLATEVRVGANGDYRVDVKLPSRVLLEVDGRAYHDDIEQREEDERRRQRIRRDGYVLLVYTWRAVMFEAGRVLAEVRDALGGSWVTAPPIR